MSGTSFGVEAGDQSNKFDDDGRPKRTGTMLTASAHIITAVIGSGVLSLAWAIAQLGWVIGPITLLVFATITWYTSTLLADCYRSPDGTRNYVYSSVVRSYLGGMNVTFCRIAQYSNLVGITVGYSITTAISMVAIKRAICFHRRGHQAGCHMSNNPYIMAFGVIQVVLSQLPNFHELSFLSIIAAVMSFAYSSIGLGLATAEIVGGVHVQTSIAGIPPGDHYSTMDKLFNSFSALGNVAFAFAFSVVLIEIQDTLKSGAPENKVMKQAALVGVIISTLFYMLCGVLGYAAFGHDAPGNFLTGFGFYEPFWLVDIANLCIVIHLIGAYQVFAQPIFAAVEGYCKKKWPDNVFVAGNSKLSLFRLIWRSCYVVLTTTIAMILPFFNDFVGLIGAVSFWPLTVYFPIMTYIARSKIQRFTCTWIWLQILNIACLAISILAACGSIRGLIQSLQNFKIFHSRS